MEQIKLIKAKDIDTLQIDINAFLNTLDEHTDIVDIHIDSNFHDGPIEKPFPDVLLATIRIATYIPQYKDVENSDEEVELTTYNGYPVLKPFNDTYCLDGGYTNDKVKLKKVEK